MLIITLINHIIYQLALILAILLFPVLKNVSRLIPLGSIDYKTLSYYPQVYLTTRSGCIILIPPSFTSLFHP